MARVRLIHPRTKEERVVDETAVGGFPGFVPADEATPKAGTGKSSGSTDSKPATGGSAEKKES